MAIVAGTTRTQVEAIAEKHGRRTEARLAPHVTYTFTKEQLDKFVADPALAALSSAPPADQETVEGLRAQIAELEAQLSQRQQEAVGDHLLAHKVACELAAMDGYDPDDMHGGLYDLRWSGGSAPEPLGDTFSLDYYPKAERIAALLASQAPENGDEAKAELLAWRKCQSTIIEALANLAKLPDQSRKDSDPSVIHREPVIREVVRMRDAVSAFGKAYFPVRLADARSLSSCQPDQLMAAAAPTTPSEAKENAAMAGEERK